MPISSPQKVLIINIFGIGDVLFTTPIIRSLKTAYPDVGIGYLCNRRTSPLLERYPQIQRVFVYERDELEALRRRSTWQYLKAVGRLIREIKTERFDVGLDVSLNSFMSFLAFAAGIPNRIGYDYKGRGIFLTKKIPLTGYEGRHVVEYYLDLLGELGVSVRQKEMELPLTFEDTAWARRFLEENGLKEGAGHLIGVIPGGGESWGKDALYKRWPPERYAKLADKLVEKYKAQIILMGGQNEAQLCAQTASLMCRMPVVSAGKTSLGQFAALARRCSLVITNDGGPLHVAAAVGTKTVSIFGPVDERVYGPYPLGDHRVINKEIACRPCYRKFRRADCAHISCLSQLSVEEVFEKVSDVL